MADHKRPIELTQSPPLPPSKKQRVTNNAESSGTKIDPVVDYKYLQAMENDGNRRPMAKYMEHMQTAITARGRTVVIEWLSKVAEDRQLFPETLFLTVDYIDRYLSKIRNLGSANFQLLAASSMLIAAIYEETEPLSPEYLCERTHYSYTVQEVVEMQAGVSSVLKDEMCNPTVMSFLRILTNIPQKDYKSSYLLLEFMSNYLAELSLLEYRCLEFLPSMVAASIIFLARFTINQTSHPWNLSLENISGYKASHLKECVKILNGVQMNEQVGKGIRVKFRSSNACRVNLSTPKAIPSIFFDDVYKYDESVYAVDIYNNLQAMENEEKRRPTAGYMFFEKQTINAKMRTMLVEWLSEVAEACRFVPETLSGAVSYLDRYLSIRILPGQNYLQLLGVSSMLIAARYDETHPPTLDYFYDLTAGSYPKKALLEMLAEVYKALKYEMGNPTIISFLRILTHIAKEDFKTSHLQLELLSNYLAELSMIEYRFLEFLPSMVAASITFLARFILNQTVYPWNSSLENISGYKASQLEECVKMLHGVASDTPIDKGVGFKYNCSSVCNIILSTFKAIPSIFFKEANSEIIFKYLQGMENEENRRPMAKYMEQVQTAITARGRAVLIEWISEVAEDCRFVPETLFLTVSQVDRYLSVRVLPRHGLYQLLAAASIIIAAGYEKLEPLRPEYLCLRTHYSYTVQEVEKMQGDVSRVLKYGMCNPTVMSFLRILTNIPQKDYKTSYLRLEFVSNYLAELSLLEYRCLEFLPSMVAASIVFLTRFTINQTSHPWNLSLESISGYKASHLKECVEIVNGVQMNEQVGMGIREKYRSSNACRVNLSTPKTIPSVFFEDANF